MRLVALLVALLVGHPLVIEPTKPVAIAAAIAMALCALGVATRWAPLVTAGVAVALGEHALALLLAGGTPRLGGAVIAGVIAALALETADFEQRFRHVTIDPGVIARQLRYWAGFGALGAMASAVLIGAASAINTTVRLPWPPVVAAVGAVAVLGAIAVALRGEDRTPETR